MQLISQKAQNQLNVPFCAFLQGFIIVQYYSQDIRLHKFFYEAVCLSS